jgi:hypothetical protein
LLAGLEYKPGCWVGCQHKDGRTGFRDIEAHELEPTDDHIGFFTLDFAFGAALRMLRDGQWSEIDIQPQQVRLERVAQGATFSTKQGFTASTQLLKLYF